MARASRSRTLASLEGKLGGIRREVQQVLRGLKREIARREGEITALKAEHARGADLLRGRETPKPASPRRRARRARQINWRQVFSALPARFTLETLTRHPLAGKRSKAHLYTTVSRWKKEGMLTADPGGGYRKVGAQPKQKQKRAPRPKPARTPKPAPRAEAPSA
jgi:hypothetical protein